MSMPEKIWAGNASRGAPDDRWWVSHPNYGGSLYIRAPTTLYEALSDYAMFGKFVARLSGDDRAVVSFVHDWLNCNQEELDAQWPQFVNFVKEEMGK